MQTGQGRAVFSQVWSNALNVLLYSDLIDVKPAHKAINKIVGDEVRLMPRNPQFFKPSEIEVADMVFATSVFPEVSEAYDDVQVLTQSQLNDEQPPPAPEPPPPLPPPVVNVLKDINGTEFDHLIHMGSTKFKNDGTWQLKRGRPRKVTTEESENGREER